MDRVSMRVASALTIPVLLVLAAASDGIGWHEETCVERET
jgi:hypothetical protein